MCCTFSSFVAVRSPRHFASRLVRPMVMHAHTKRSKRNARRQQEGEQKRRRGNTKNLICNKTLSSPAALVRQSGARCFSFFFFVSSIPLCLTCFMCASSFRFQEEKKSVISNFLIVIVFVLYCVPLWLFYDLFMKFMLVFVRGRRRSPARSPPRTWHKRDHYYAF